MKRTLLLLALVVLSYSISIAQQTGSIVGTWKLLSYIDTPENGTPVHPWGRKPSGLLIYDDTGHMAVQIQRTPIDKRVIKASASLKQADKIDLLGGYTAYFGKYSIDWQRMIVTHHVEGNLFPVYIGTNQEKNFEVAGDRLTLKVSWTEGGNHWAGVRLFSRIRVQKGN